MDDLYPTPRAAAGLYAALGWRVAPVRPGSKVPIPPAWQEVATTDESIIDAWWDKYAGAGVCIVTGRESGIWVLDVDVAGGKPGMESLRAIVREHGDGSLPETIVARTPSGGYHYYFAYPDVVEIRNSAGNRLGPGLDVRGEGGQVNAAPTARAEGAYRWADGRAPWEAEVQPAPAWLVDLVAEDTKVSDPIPPNLDALGKVLYGSSPAWVDDFNASHSWSQLLAGWTEAFTDRDGVTHWVRPGKERREGTSATTNYAGSDLLYVYTTSVPWLPSDRAYDKYGFVVHRDHRGDFEAAAEAFKPARASAVADLLDHEPVRAATNDEPATDDDRSRLERAEIPLSSAEFWNADTQDDDFLIEPFIAAGRAHALFAEAKAGKSYVVLQALAAAAVPGHDSWIETPKSPVTILYLDYEMTENDLRERLEIFGYGPDDDYSHLHYVKASMLGGDLDTYEGGIELLDQAQRWACDLVVIDTMSRAVTGDENDADTVRKFYQHTGRLLKANGIAWLRIDHAGKDKTRGQRGSSGKNDDVDVVWKLERTDSGTKLSTTHSRVFWMPSTIDLSTKATETGAVVHVPANGHSWPQGTGDKAAEWLKIGIPLDASRARAKAAGLVFTAADFPAIRRYAGELFERQSVSDLIGSGGSSNQSEPAEP